jgi:hypothetical protein
LRSIGAREKESLYIKYEGEENESDELQWKTQMKLFENAK